MITKSKGLQMPAPGAAARELQEMVSGAMAQEPHIEATQGASNTATQIHNNTDSNAGSKQHSYIDTQQPVNGATQVDSHTDSNAPPLLSVLPERFAGPHRATNMRLPEAIGEYLDEAAHRGRREGVTKQDIVALAVSRLMDDIAGGADLVALLTQAGLAGRRR